MIVSDYGVGIPYCINVCNCINVCKLHKVPFPVEYSLLVDSGTTTCSAVCNVVLHNRS